jgi:hypothetical protein
MNDCTAVFENGDLHSGSYNGYGRIGGVQFVFDFSKPYPYPTYIEEENNNAQLWHTACWKKKGEPAFSGPSDSADDQGWFFDEGHYDKVVPGVPFKPEEEEHEKLEAVVPGS